MNNIEVGTLIIIDSIRITIPRFNIFVPLILCWYQHLFITLLLNWQHTFRTLLPSLLPLTAGISLSVLTADFFDYDVDNLVYNCEFEHTLDWELELVEVSLMSLTSLKLGSSVWAWNSAADSSRCFGCVAAGAAVEAAAASSLYWLSSLKFKFSSRHQFFHARWLRNCWRIVDERLAIRD